MKQTRLTRKKLKERAKFRKPICVIYFPIHTSQFQIHKALEGALSDLKRDYHVIAAVSEECKVEVHGTSKLTSFKIEELKGYIADEMKNILQ